MSFDKKKKHYAKSAVSLNPFRAGRCLSTAKVEIKVEPYPSQSLSSRAMSFDRNWPWERRVRFLVSIPFEQGDFFRQNQKDLIILLACLNPFRAGRCLSTYHQLSTCSVILQSQSLSSRAMSFDHQLLLQRMLLKGLNPFRAGRCLSTSMEKSSLHWCEGLNPFRAGRCLSTEERKRTSSS